MLYWRPSDNHIVFLELERLYALCTFVQHKAQADNRTYEIVLDEKKGTINSPFFSETIAPQVLFGTIKGVRGPPATPTHPIKKAITFIGSKIVCEPTGIMQAGAIYLTDRHHHCLYALSIAVGKISYIRRYVHRNNWVLL